MAQINVGELAAKLTLDARHFMTNAQRVIKVLNQISGVAANTAIAMGKDMQKGSDLAARGQEAMRKNTAMTAEEQKAATEKILKDLAELQKEYQATANVTLKVTEETGRFGQSAAKAQRAAQLLGKGADFVEQSMREAAQVGQNVTDVLSVFGLEMSRGAQTIARWVAGAAAFAGVLRLMANRMNLVIVGLSALGGILTAAGGGLTSLSGKFGMFGGVLARVLGFLGPVGRALGTIVSAMGPLALITGSAMTAMGTGSNTLASFLGIAVKFTPVIGGLISAIGKLGPLKSVLLAVFGVKMFKFILGAAQATSAMNEQMNALRVQFNEAGNATVKWAQETAVGYQMSSTQAAQAAASFGAFFDAVGASDQAASKASTAMAQLATDLASFRNLGVDDALQKIQAGLAGEYEPLRRVGVFLNEAAVQQEAYRLKLADTGQELTEGQKILARYSLIVKQTEKAQGDAARTSMSLANQQRQGAANSAKLGEEAGKLGLPFATLAQILKNLGTHIIGHFLGGVNQIIGLIPKAISAVDGLLQKGRDFLGIVDMGNGKKIGEWFSKTLGSWTGANTDAEKSTNDLQGALEALVGELGGGIANMKNSEKQLESFNKLLEEGDFYTAKQVISTIEAAGATKEHKESVTRLQGAWDTAIATQRRKIEVDRENKQILEELEFAINGVTEAEKWLNKERDRRAGLVEGLLSSAEKLESADKDVTEARADLADADAKVNELKKKGLIDTEKLERAERAWKDATDNLADAREDLAEIQKKIDELLAPATEREITEATIAHARALRAVREAELDYADAIDAVWLAQRKVEDLERDITQLRKDQIENARLLAAAYAGVEGELTDFASEIQSSVRSAMDATKRIVPELEDVEQGVMSLEEAQRRANDVVGRFGRESDKGKKALEDLAAAQERANQKQDDGRLTLARLRENMRENLKVMKAWQGDLKTVADRGFPELARSMAKLGPEAAAVVAEMARGSTADLTEMAGLFSETEAIGETKSVVGLARALGDTGISTEYINGLQEEGAEIARDLEGKQKDLAAAYRDVERANMNLATAEEELQLVHFKTIDTAQTLNELHNKGKIVTDELKNLINQRADAEERVNKAIEDQAIKYGELEQAKLVDPERQNALKAAEEARASANERLATALDAQQRASFDYKRALEELNGPELTHAQQVHDLLTDLQAANLLPPTITKDLKLNVGDAELNKTLMLKADPNQIAGIAAALGIKTSEELSKPENSAKVAKFWADNFANSFGGGGPVGGNRGLTPTAFPVGARGALVSRPTLAMIGEAGPEAVIPLDRMPGARSLDTLGNGGRGGGEVTIIEIHMPGFVGTQRDLINALHEGMLAKQRRGGSMKFE